MKILLIAEHDNQTLKSGNFHTLSAAKQLGDTIDCLIMGYQCEKVVLDAKKLPYINEILVADASEYTHQLAENTTTLIAEIAKDYDYILVSANTFGKNLLPRVAALLDVGMIADVLDIVSEDTFVRPQQQ